MKSFFVDTKRGIVFLKLFKMYLSGGEALTVYADVLVAINILITYIFLVCTRVACKMATNKIFVALGSLAGGFFSLVIFMDIKHQILSVLIKLLTGAIIVAISFLPRNIRGFLKLYLGFFTVSIIFGGIMYFLEITLNPQKIIFYNGTVYFDMSLTYLVGSVLLIYGAFLVVQYFLDRKAVSACQCQVEISFRNVSVFLPAIIDTGNSLTDGLTGRPVAVAELSAVAPLFSFEELDFLEKGDYVNVPHSLKKYIRIVPCGTVTGDKVLTGFLPDRITIKTNVKSYVNDYCVVGVVNKNLSDGEYKALLNENLLLNCREEKQNEHSVI
jgi:stage II sporulation protein GA (sporulation sigma-E factor processing peptidase)